MRSQQTHQRKLHPRLPSNSTPKSVGPMVIAASLEPAKPIWEDGAPPSVGRSDAARPRSSQSGMCCTKTTYEGAMH